MLFFDLIAVFDHDIAGLRLEGRRQFFCMVIAPRTWHDWAGSFTWQTQANHTQHSMVMKTLVPVG
jgi:hypothetical protein